MLLCARNLGKHFGRVPALAPTSFTLEEGEHLTLRGPSGSGKTTLLRLLAGLILPSSGEIHESGRLINSPGGAYAPWRRSLGMLFQNLALWPHLSARGQLEMVLGGWPGGRRGRRARARELLERLGLLRLEDRFPASLSGGERQRLAWARAIAPEPRLLLLDEPLTSLDPQLKEDLLALTAGYGATPRRTVVLVTHDPEIARRLGWRVLELVPAGAPSGSAPEEAGT
jgi:iron(III) transport system ATP-binding protein